MPSSENAASNLRVFVTAAVVCAAVAILRFFLKGLLAPLGVPTVVGSFLSSVTIVLIVSLVVLFLREGRNPDGRYWKAGAWFAGLAVWFQALIICGILLTEQTGKDTYYTGPWEMARERFPNATAHAIGHAQGVILLIILGLVLGAPIYLLAKRGRRSMAQPGA